MAAALQQAPYALLDSPQDVFAVSILLQSCCLATDECAKGCSLFHPLLSPVIPPGLQILLGGSALASAPPCSHPLVVAGHATASCQQHRLLLGGGVGGGG